MRLYCAKHPLTQNYNLLFTTCSHDQKSQNLLTNVMIITLSLLIPQQSAIQIHYHYHKQLLFL